MSTKTETNKSYTVLSPTGKTHNISRENLNKFCAQYRLDAPTMRKVLSPTSNNVSHRGWSSAENPRTEKVYALISPKGNIIKVKPTGVVSFCRRVNMSQTGFYRLKLRQIDNYKGWKFDSQSTKN